MIEDVSSGTGNLLVLVPSRDPHGDNIRAVRVLRGAVYAKGADSHPYRLLAC